HDDHIASRIRSCSSHCQFLLFRLVRSASRRQIVLLTRTGVHMLGRLRSRKEWNVFAVLLKASKSLAFAWWFVLVLRGALPALFAIAMGSLIGAVSSGAALRGPLAFVGVIFILLQVASPIHRAIGANLGSVLAAWLYD